MRQKIIYLLKLAGLAEDEIKIFLLILKLQKCTAGELILQSKFNHMKVYRMIDLLFERGLIDLKYINEKQRIIMPLSLTALINKVQGKQKKLKRLELALFEMNKMMGFCDLESEETQELIEFKEGIEAFREEYLKFPDICENEYLHVGSMQNYWDAAKLSYDDAMERAFIKKRIRKNIYARIVNTTYVDAERWMSNDSREKRTTRIQDKNLPVIKNYLGIAENQVSYFLCEKDNPQVIVIRQPEMVQLYKNSFEKIWG